MDASPLVLFYFWLTSGFASLSASSSSKSSSIMVLSHKSFKALYFINSINSEFLLLRISFKAKWEWIYSISVKEPTSITCRTGALKLFEISVNIDFRYWGWCWHNGIGELQTLNDPTYISNEFWWCPFFVRWVEFIPLSSCGNSIIFTKI